MLGIGVGIGVHRGETRGFDSGDIANGTFRMNFVDKPPQTFGMNFLTQTYSSWANDSTSSLAGLTGYYQSKG